MQRPSVTRRERTIKKLVAWATALLFHRVEVRQQHDLTSTGSQLANSSHFGGFTDPLVLIRAMDRVPRFIARDVIWNYPVVRSILNWVGAIPVHKSEDGGPSSNDQMFRSTYEALGEDDLVTIFPEGITVDDPRIAHIKTGSARIALGARASGVENITLLSAGIHYQNKAALRSEVFIDIGYPIDLDAWVAANIAPGDPQDATNRAAVTALTSQMETHLRRAAPDFEDWVTARNLTAASAVALRQAVGPEGSVGHGDKERLARLLDDAPDEEKQAVVDTMELYQGELDALGFSDEMFVTGLSTKWAFLWNIVKDIVIGMLLLPFAVIGILVNAIPMAIVWLIGRLKVDDAMMATIKPLGAIFVFLVTWVFWLWRAWVIGGFEILAAMLVLMPFYLFALIALVERLTLLAKAVRSLLRSKSIKDVYEQVHEDREAVVEAVAQAV
jgi:glycerol-3-phosphate O-acyltransferase/dihydroxyacetone phosphate acyltransferase